MPEHEERASEERTTTSDNKGGLYVEDRVEVLPSSRNLFEELAVAAREVNPGEVRSLTTSISLAPPEMSTQFFDVSGLPRPSFAQAPVPSPPTAAAWSIPS